MAVAHHISELVNITPDPQQPYVGVSAFAHKAGLHASAIKVDPYMYQHADPQAVHGERRLARGTRAEIGHGGVQEVEHPPEHR